MEQEKKVVRPRLSRDIINKIEATHDKVNAIDTILRDNGLMSQVKHNTKKLGRLELKLWGLIAFLVGSGVLSGGLLLGFR